MKDIKILFIEDHTMIRCALKLMLKNQTSFNAIIDDVGSGAEGIQMASKTNYDLVLLDINMPDINGVEVAKKLKTQNDSIKILVLSMHEEEHLVKQMLDAGVLGYILKNSGVDELTKAILSVNNYQNYYCNEISQIILNDYKNTTPESFEEILTKREIEILKEIALALSDKEIANKLKISYRTVGNHKSNLLQKLKINKTAGLVAFAYKNNIV